jgi:hypothetical protein
MSARTRSLSLSLSRHDRVTSRGGPAPGPREQPPGPAAVGAPPVARAAEPERCGIQRLFSATLLRRKSGHLKSGFSGLGPLNKKPDVTGGDVRRAQHRRTRARAKTCEVTSPQARN